MKVGVTTSIDRFPAWEGPLAAAGFETVRLPCIAIQDLERSSAARLASRRADLVVITSPRTIPIVWADHGMGGLAVASVGPATTAAAEAAGARVVHQSAGGAQELANELSGRLRARRVVYLHSAGAEPAIGRRLRAEAGSFESVAVYRTRSIPPGDEPVQTAVFGSPSAVEGWLSGREFPPVVGAIGPTTEAALRSAGHELVISPTVPGVDSLARALRRELETIP
jgi:uroporphyrinogen-III synthase